MRDKEYKALQADNIKALCKLATENRVQKEDIVQIIEIKDLIYLIYLA